MSSSSSAMIHGAAARTGALLSSRVRGGRQLTSSSSSASTTTTRGTKSSSSATRGVVAVRAAAGVGKTVVFVGGTGRVGSSAAAALVASDPSVSTVVLAGRSEDNARAAMERHPSLAGAQFAAVDSADPASLAAALAGADLVVHSAGPFQGGGDDCAVLRAAIAAKVPYLDVCDDVEYAKKARRMSHEAEAAGIPAITSAGIYPGVSNVMAAEMIATNRAAAAAAAAAAGDSDDEGEGAVAAAADAGSGGGVEYVLYNYFCAGSGGVGTTILATSYMLCGEEVVCWDGGEEVRCPPATQRKVVDFGKKCGKRECFIYNLPETASAREVFGARTVKARFGTSPGIWNFAMVLMASLVPRDVLLNKSTAAGLAAFTVPLVRAVDSLVGERTAMRVDTKMTDGTTGSGVFNHPRLSEAVGDATAAFASAVLRGETAPGVWYPEEDGALKDRARLLEEASKGCDNYQINKAAWMLESKPINLGFGMYLE